MRAATAPTLLITRPEPGASATAERLRALGFNVFAEPLTKIVPLDFDEDLLCLEAAKPGTLIAITSANAIRALPVRAIDAIKQLRVFTVGKQTAQTARHHGFSDVTEGGGDANELAAGILKTGPTNLRVIYLAGVTRRPEFEAALFASNAEVHVHETYGTQIVSHLTHKLQSLLCQPSQIAPLVYSQQSSIALKTFLQQLNGNEIIDFAALFAISQQAFEPLAKAVNSPIIIAERPDEEAMVTAICQYFNR